MAAKLFKPIRDGLENLVSQLGTAQDKRAFSTFVNNKRLSARGNEYELNAMYRTVWLAGKIVDIVPDDMTREWREFSGDIDPDTVDMLIEEEERLQLVKKVNLAHKWARLYGTSFIVLAVDDGLPPDQPLNIDAVKLGALKHINVVDKMRINVADVVPIGNPMDRYYGMPEYYRLNETAIKIHHSRVLRFDAVQLPFDEFRCNNYFSDSVLDRLYDAIINLETVTSASASLVHESNVDIFKVPGLMQYLQDPEAEKRLIKRFTLANQMKSINNALLLGEGEEHSIKNTNFSGLPELTDRFAQLITAATDIPATRLLGVSASGFNSTGEGDLKNYYDMLRSKQITEYKPLLDYFDKIMAKSLGIADDADLSYKFCSLFQMTDKEQAELELIRAQRDATYIDRDVVDNLVVAKELKQQDTYTNITDEFLEELEEAASAFELTPAAQGPNNFGEGEEGGGDQNPQIPGSAVPEAATETSDDDEEGS